MILASASPVSLLLAAAAALAYAVPALAARALGAQAARRVLLLAWLLHGALLAWGVLGREPRFGFAPALSITVWLVLTVYAIESQLYPQMKARWALAGFGTLAIVLALLFPGAHPPATSSALLPLLTLERLMFRFLGAGFVLLTLTMLAGAFFGEQLYGASYTGWRWDHKRVFTLLSWLTFGTLLAGRWWFGWRGRRAVRVLYIGAALLLLGYVGSRFVLEVLLGRTA